MRYAAQQAVLDLVKRNESDPVAAAARVTAAVVAVPAAEAALGGGSAANAEPGAALESADAATGSGGRCRSRDPLRHSPQQLWRAGCRRGWRTGGSNRSSALT